MGLSQLEAKSRGHIPPASAGGRPSLTAPAPPSPPSFPLTGCKLQEDREWLSCLFPTPSTVSDWRNCWVPPAQSPHLGRPSLQRQNHSPRGGEDPSSCIIPSGFTLLLKSRLLVQNRKAGHNPAPPRLSFCQGPHTLFCHMASACATPSHCSLVGLTQSSETAPHISSGHAFTTEFQSSFPAT